MIRSMLAKNRDDAVDGFRWRSREISRIEGFNDAVFGFAITREWLSRAVEPEPPAEA